MTPDQIREALNAWFDQELPTVCDPQQGVDTWYIETVIDFPKTAQFLFDKLRPIEKVLEEIDAHSVEFPSHGYNCICMDNYIREVRKLVGNTKVGSRLSDRRLYVLQTAIKPLY